MVGAPSYTSGAHIIKALYSLLHHVDENVRITFYCSD